MVINIQSGQPLQGELRVPADKSISHRAVILSALAPGRSTIHNFLPAADTFSTLRCVQELGVTVERQGTVLQVHGRGWKGLREPARVLDCGNSGTTMRLLSGLVAGCPFFTVLSGDPSLQQRPMDRVIEPLRQMGAYIDGRHNGTRAPLVIRGGKLQGINYPLPVPSAQLKSAILLAGLQAEGETVLMEPVVSRDHTERMLQAMGADLQLEEKVIRLRQGNELKPQEFYVPGDISSAAFFIVGASLVPGSEIILRDVGINPTRTGLITVLQQMGALIQIENKRMIRGEPVADLLVRYAPLHEIELGGELIPLLIDEIPVLAIAMAAAEGDSMICEARELRVKETDRIQAICDNLSALGILVQEYADGFRVRGTGGKIKGGRVDSRGDHRLAMAMGIAGLVAKDGVQLSHAEVVNVSYPDFWTDLSRLAGTGDFF